MKKQSSIYLDIAQELGPLILSAREGRYKDKNKLSRKNGGRVVYEVKQIDLAKKLNISAQFLGKIEKGLVPIPDHIQAQLVVELKIPKKSLHKIYESAGKRAFERLVKNTQKIQKTSR